MSAALAPCEYEYIETAAACLNDRDAALQAAIDILKTEPDLLRRRAAGAFVLAMTNPKRKAA